MPEKTRDRKNWFPRFKSNWLGTYRSKQMFVCCECAVTDAESARYKGAEGKHCVCGRDQWHLAKSVEEAEYNRRMEISKSFGGLRYEEAVETIKSRGGSEFSEYDDKRVRCESDESSASTSSVNSVDSNDYHMSKRIKLEPSSMSPASRGFTHEIQLSMGPNLYSYDQHMNHYGAPPMKSTPSYPVNHPNYTPLGADMLSTSPYDHLAPPPFTDEESFGELLQGILEDDPRKMANSTRPASYQYAQAKRYPDASMPMAHQPVDFDYYHGSSAMPPHNHQLHQQAHHGYASYHQPHFHQHQASFPSAV